MGSLPLDKESFLIDLKEFYSNDPDVVPQGFETNFLTNILERFENEGAEMFVSPKMMAIIKRIGEERYGMNWDAYKDE